MATQETQIVDNIISSRRALLVGGGAAMAAFAAPSIARAASTLTAVSDNDILNFALNLEYLEANFYYAAAFGTTIDKATTPISINGGAGGTGVTATVKANPKVPFTSIQVASYAIETAMEEGRHVQFLTKTLGTAAVAQPPIDLMTSFNTLASAAGIGPTFDPFSSDAFFLIGAYIFEDVGVTAYHGAAPLISNAGVTGGILAAAAGILAVEAYHAGLIRTTIQSLDPDGSYATLTQQISVLRSKLSLAANTAVTTTDDFGLGPQTVTLGSTTGVTASTLLDADANAIAFARNTTQVLNIVTGGGALTTGVKATGVFFPSGLNGTIS